MKYIIIILFFPLLASSQGAIVDAGGNIINYQKYTDSVPGVYATGTRLRIKADSVALALVASLALKLNLSDSAAMLSNYQRKALGIPTYARVTGSNVTTTGQALVNITGLSIALVANATYEFEAVLSVSTSAVTTGTAYGVNYSAAGATVESHITGASTSTAAKTLRISALNTATTLYLATSAQTGGILIKGIVTTGANAGNFTISHLKLTSGTSTVFINSFLKCTRII